jgi:hypothetical protein
MNANTRTFAIALLTSAVATPTWAQELGRVHFQTSCTLQAQEKFDRGLALVHSFFYPDSVQAFTEAAAADPQCAIAYWGIAVVRRSPSTSLTRGRLQTFTPPLSTLPMSSDRKADSRSRIHLLTWRRVRGGGTVSDNLRRSSSPHALASLVRTFREQKRQTQDTTEALPSMRHSPTALPQTVRH